MLATRTVRQEPQAGAEKRDVSVFDLVRLRPLMQRIRGRAEIVIGLIDGPIVTDHPSLRDVRIQSVRSACAAVCTRPESAACAHGTFVAGLLGAGREEPTPGICPGCTILVWPPVPGKFA